MVRSFLIGCLVAGAIFAPAELPIRTLHAQEPAPAVASAAVASHGLRMSDEFDFGQAAASKGPSKLNFRLALRFAMLRGKVDRSQGRTALGVLNDRAQSTALFESLGDLRADQVAAGETPVIDAITKLLEWVIANWDTIFKIIQTIIALFVADVLRRFRWCGDRWLMA